MAVKMNRQQFTQLIERIVKIVLEDDGRCPESGCVKKIGYSWRVVSNKTGKLWPQTYDTKQDAEDAIAAYHVHNNG